MFRNLWKGETKRPNRYGPVVVCSKLWEGPFFRKEIHEKEPKKIVSISAPAFQNEKRSLDIESFPSSVSKFDPERERASQSWSKDLRISRLSHEQWAILRKSGSTYFNKAAPTAKTSKRQRPKTTGDNSTWKDQNKSRRGSISILT